MAQELPEPLQWVLLLLAGCRWPEADEDQLREMADHWRKTADGIEHAGQLADTTMKNALEGQRGGGAEAAAAAWADYTTGKGTEEDPGLIPGMVQACRGMGDMLESMANSAETAKITIVAQLGIMAVEIATAEAAAVETLGASMATIPEIIAAGRAAVMAALKTLLKDALKFALRMAIQMGAINLLAQGIEVAEGHRKSIDMKELGQAVEGGAISGAAGHLLGKGLGVLGNSALGKGAMGTLGGRIAHGAATGVGTDVVTQLAMTGKVDPNSLLGSGLSGGAGVGIHAGAQGIRDHFNGPPKFGPEGGVPGGGAHEAGAHEGGTPEIGDPVPSGEGGRQDGPPPSTSEIGDPVPSGEGGRQDGPPPSSGSGGDNSTYHGPGNSPPSSSPHESTGKIAPFGSDRPSGSGSEHSAEQPPKASEESGGEEAPLKYQYLNVGDGTHPDEVRAAGGRFEEHVVPDDPEPVAHEPVVQEHQAPPAEEQSRPHEDDPIDESQLQYLDVSGPDHSNEPTPHVEEPAPAAEHESDAPPSHETRDNQDSPPPSYEQTTHHDPVPEYTSTAEDGHQTISHDEFDQQPHTGEDAPPAYEPAGEKSGHDAPPAYEPAPEKSGHDAPPAYEPAGEKTGHDAPPAYEPASEKSGHDAPPAYEPVAEKSNHEAPPAYQETASGGGNSASGAHAAPNLNIPGGAHLSGSAPTTHIDGGTKSSSAPPRQSAASGDTLLANPDGAQPHDGDAPANSGQQTAVPPMAPGGGFTSGPVHSAGSRPGGPDRPPTAGSSGGPTGRPPRETSAGPGGSGLRFGPARPRVEEPGTGAPADKPKPVNENTEVRPPVNEHQNPKPGESDRPNTTEGGRPREGGTTDHIEGEPEATTSHTPDDITPHEEQTNHNPHEEDPVGQPEPHEEPFRPAIEDRPLGEEGGLEKPSVEDEERVKLAVPKNPDGTAQRHPDPWEGDWHTVINGDKRLNPLDQLKPGRNNNCVDATLALLDTFDGHPTPAAARTPEFDEHGNPSDLGELGGRDRIERNLGAKFSDLGDGPDAFNRLEDTLRGSGHGSKAAIMTIDENGRSHTWVAVNHNDRITYLDGQTGGREDKPLRNGDSGAVFAIPLDPNRKPVTPAPHSDPNHDPATERRAPERPGNSDDVTLADGQEPAGSPDASSIETPELRAHERPFDDLNAHVDKQTELHAKQSEPYKITEDFFFYHGGTKEDLTKYVESSGSGSQIVIPRRQGNATNEWQGLYVTESHKGAAGYMKVKESVIDTAVAAAKNHAKIAEQAMHDAAEQFKNNPDDYEASMRKEETEKAANLASSAVDMAPIKCMKEAGDAFSRVRISIRPEKVGGLEIHPYSSEVAPEGEEPKRQPSKFHVVAPNEEAVSGMLAEKIRNNNPGMLNSGDGLIADLAAENIVIRHQLAGGSKNFEFIIPWSKVTENFHIITDPDVPVYDSSTMKYDERQDIRDSEARSAASRPELTEDQKAQRDAREQREQEEQERRDRDTAERIRKFEERMKAKEQEEDVARKAKEEEEEADRKAKEEEEEAGEGSETDGEVVDDGKPFDPFDWM
ncbi:hypothetical protein CFP65_1834 [Kitasatospora sp. MMS16-BH015]|uniref:toxin glutamine deamidase domain-containing protein n=1 Tax=Kitasatospora sp. MMS16-BH015 TaxID=2018025 RepID=UPI000CA30A58|nr:toxin glutamine deamidase domain-containing protein [Kitasatospora sp. MMS16-BH015]AUG76708.1 hypothetical protein CFP65_1834 [Kitasatospora sp. MMS16-BH015]